MALQAEIIPFTLRTGAGTQTISQVLYPSMTAKAVIFVSADQFRPGQAFLGYGAYGFGVDDGTTHIANALSYSEVFGVCISERMYSAEYSLLAVQGSAGFGGAIQCLKGYVSALLVGSIQITLDLNSVSGSFWYAIVIGGDDVEAKVGIRNLASGAGTEDCGFDPIALFQLGVPLTGTGQVAGAANNYGFAVPCDTDSVAWGVAAGTINSNSKNFQVVDLFKGEIGAADTVGVATPTPTKTISGYPADGFAIAGSAFTVGFTDWYPGYLAIGGSGVSANLVAFNQPTTTGAQSVTIDADNPVIAFFTSTCAVTATTVNANANNCFGAYDGTTQFGVWAGQQNAQPFPYKHHSNWTNAGAVLMNTATGAGTSTNNAAAVATGLSANTISLNWTAADATQREVWALVLAQNLTGSSNPCGDNPQASLTVIKNTTPIPGGETEFPFSATGGLSPSTFSLMDGESQLFDSLAAGTYGIIEEPPAGWTVSYDVSNSSPNDAITVGTGEAVTVTVTNTFESTSNTLVRYRRFALPNSENKEVFISRLEIVAAMGVGNADAPDPEIQMRFSRDGGNTYGPWRTMAIGQAGEYARRAFLTRLGRGRNWVAELLMDDPVFAAWVQCDIEADKGTS